MAIKLYEHNQTAYDAAIAMLSETGKAAVIHPTGTGKSFLGFKLCEEHPEKHICWLSPSEYIFKTQKENLATTGAEIPANITFLTYAKLMTFSPDEVSAIAPDCIILDEFHRCGAEYWGLGVQRLLAAYPNAPVLGLSATNIRYLDNRRDMAAELFDGCVASEMTLGEAVVRGILAPPKYVISVFSYAKDIKRYEAKIRRAKNKAVKIKAEDYLQKIRRAIENADGLNAIFQKHIEDRSGKYILFVPNVESLRTVKGKCKEWCRGIDMEPHIYSAYSNDPETSKAFADFKADESEHLKVLIAINMLNEGVHVEGISGVILFRPTVSPIIYKQQIGRALSASKTESPLILDIVANVYNLYSVDSLKSEIAETIQLFHERGEDDKIAVEDFSVFDEVADCRKLFEHLDEVLSSSWDEMYGRLCRFKKTHPGTDPANTYRTPDGVALGAWCNRQRRIRRGTSPGILTEEHIRELDAIGFEWNPGEGQWEKAFKNAAAYRKQFHSMDIPGDFITEDGLKLGRWIRSNRVLFRQGKLSKDKIQRLNEIQMIWDIDEYRWQQNLERCRSYLAEQGCLPPRNYIAPDGVRLGRWLANVIARHISKPERYRELSDNQIQLLEELGVVFERKKDRQWKQTFAVAKEYVKQYHSWDFPEDVLSSDGAKLSSWVDYQRKCYAGLNGRPLAKWKKEMLDAAAFDWTITKKQEDQWPAYIESLKRYMAKTKGKVPSQRYVDEAGRKIGYWLSNQRSKFRKGTLAKDRAETLKSLGVKLENARDAMWQEGFIHAKASKPEFPSMKIPALYKMEDGYPLGEWMRTQVKMEAAGTLKKERKTMLDGLGVPWKSMVESRRESMIP